MSALVRAKGTQIHAVDCRYVSDRMEPYEITVANVDSTIDNLCSICFPDPCGAEYGLWDHLVRKDPK